VDIHEAYALLVRDKGQTTTTLVNLVLADQRVWLLEFPDRKAAISFELAVQESKKAFFTNSSWYMRQSDYEETKVFNDFFSMHSH
jgi:hypothetical protein